MALINRITGAAPAGVYSFPRLAMADLQLVYLVLSPFFPALLLCSSVLWSRRHKGVGYCHELSSLWKGFAFFFRCWSFFAFLFAPTSQKPTVKQHQPLSPSDTWLNHASALQASTQGKSLPKPLITRHWARYWHRTDAWPCRRFFLVFFWLTVKVLFSFLPLVRGEITK